MQGIKDSVQALISARVAMDKKPIGDNGAAFDCSEQVDAVIAEFDLENGAEVNKRIIELADQMIQQYNDTSKAAKEFQKLAPSIQATRSRSGSGSNTVVDMAASSALSGGGESTLGSVLYNAINFIGEAVSGAFQEPPKGVVTHGDGTDVSFDESASKSASADASGTGSSDSSSSSSDASTGTASGSHDGNDMKSRSVDIDMGDDEEAAADAANHDFTLSDEARARRAAATAQTQQQGGVVNMLYSAANAVRQFGAGVAQTFANDMNEAQQSDGTRVIVTGDDNVEVISASESEDSIDLDALAGQIQAEADKKREEMLNKLAAAVQNAADRRKADASESEDGQIMRPKKNNSSKAVGEDLSGYHTPTADKPANAPTTNNGTGFTPQQLAAALQKVVDENEKKAAEEKAKADAERIAKEAVARAKAEAERKAAEDARKKAADKNAEAEKAKAQKSARNRLFGILGVTAVFGAAATAAMFIDAKNGHSAGKFIWNSQVTQAIVKFFEGAGKVIAKGAKEFAKMVSEGASKLATSMRG